MIHREHRPAPFYGIRPLRGLAALALMVGALVLAGCVERTITITSEPAGALVYLNDEEVGRTPVVVPFTFYGKYDVRLQRQGYSPMWTQGNAEAPWWEFPGPDLIAELTSQKVNLNWHYKLEPRDEDDVTTTLENAYDIRDSTTGKGKSKKSKKSLKAGAAGSATTQPAQSQPTGGTPFPDIHTP